MMDPAYADQTLQQALDNAYRGEQPYLVAKMYSGSVNDRLKEIYSLARGIPLIRSITMEAHSVILLIIHLRAEYRIHVGNNLDFM